MKNTTERPSSELSPAYAGFYPVIAPLIMAQGVGDGKTTACLVAQAATIDALRKGLTLAKATDQLECACPVLRNMAISANDSAWWKSNEERTHTLRPLIPLLLDSRVSLETTKKRAARFSNAVIHDLTPMRLEWISANTKNADYAKACRDGIKKIAAIAPITDKASAVKARETLLGLKSSTSADADAYAYADASAYAYVYASAYAYAYVYADAYVYAYASAYAYAYVYASAYAYVYAYASAYAYVYAYDDAYDDASADAKKQKLKYRAAYLALFVELAAMKD